MKRPIVRNCFLVASIALCVHATAALAQSNDIDSSSTKAVEKSGIQSDPTARDSTAEDILRTLRRIRPQGELIRSARMIQRGNIVKKAILYPEGTHLVSQVGSVREGPIWWHFQFEENGKPTSLKMLPNATLEAVVRSARGQEQSIRFVVSGQRTVYKGENYLFPRIATRSTAKPTPTVDPTATAPQSQSEPGIPASADDVLARIREQQPSEQILPRSTNPSQRQINKPSPTAYLQDGAPLIRRLGRVVPRGDWLTFVFESDTLEYPELPLKLLPNQAVELMQQTAQQETEGVVFIVSGEVTAFMGENYLLPNIALRRVDAGNLTK